MKMTYLLTHNILIDMKKLMIFPAIIACLIFSAVAYGQNRGKDERKEMPTVEEMIDFECKKLTKRLLLDDADTKKFVKTYTDYRKEFIAIKDKYPILCRRNKDEMLTDAQIEEKIQSLFAQGKDMIAVREKYYKEFRKFLTPRQIDVIFDSERHRFHKFKNEGNRRKGGKPKR